MTAKTLEHSEESTQLVARVAGGLDLLKQDSKCLGPETHRLRCHEAAVVNAATECKGFQLLHSLYE